MQCDYHDTGRCRSCTWLHLPYADQLARKQADVARTLAAVAPRVRWLDAVPSAPAAFRNKAKLVVGGRVGALTAGILDGRGRGVDLRECGLYEPGLSAAIPQIIAFAQEALLVPYAVPERRGELKHILVTVAPGGELMIRFVLRSTHHLAGLRSRLPLLRATLPAARVVSVNIQPVHQAIIEGEREILLTDLAELRMSVNGIPLHLRPGGFFQTNTAVAGALYRQAQAWIDGSDPRTVWDLYCGVGGFALHAVAPGRRVVGVELSAEAIASARLALAEIPVREAGPVDFVVSDAAAAVARLADSPDLIVVNPPRRGLDPGLTERLDSSSAAGLIYSSCNPATLARDLAALPTWTAREARVFDMFPQTSHLEVAVFCSRRSGPIRPAISSAVRTTNTSGVDRV